MNHKFYLQKISVEDRVSSIRLDLLVLFAEFEFQALIRPLLHMYMSQYFITPKIAYYATGAKENYLYTLTQEFFLIP
jgi:hypothetical protein